MNKIILPHLSDDCLTYPKGVLLSFISEIAAAVPDAVSLEMQISRNCRFCSFLCPENKSLC
ncbi:hypothetical protein [Daejeonia sp. YH14]|uniref:hypothetical protein n=1 Tax=Daejeonia sp. YH14 TaxID=3439042 RepID=UPI003F496926